MSLSQWIRSLWSRWLDFLESLAQDLDSLWSRLMGFLASLFLGRDLMDLIFSATRQGARFRRWTVTIVVAILWAVYAFWVHPFQEGVDFGRSFWDYPFRALFAADVFRVVLLAGLAFWVAYRVAAIYLDDVFELGNVEVARRFLRQSAFADEYRLIEIQDGKVADIYQYSPVFMIGGPGMVRVYLENAALFEKIGGRAREIPPTVKKSGDRVDRNSAKGPVSPLSRRVIRERLIPSLQQQLPPGDGVAVLDSFERLRSVIDLRDQFETITVKGRTRDGIPVTVQGIQVIFSVYRGNKEPTLTDPYPFEQKAIETLVYTQSRLGVSITNWSTTLLTLINQELGGFIGKRSLGELLAAIGEPEIEKRVKEEADLQQEANRRAGIAGLLPAQAGASSQPPPPFTPRSSLSDQFYDINAFVEQARKQGVELRWIGVGTWAIPSEIIPDQHQTAWRITRENALRGGDLALQMLFEESRLGELVILIYDAPLGVFRGLNSKDETQRKNIMLSLVNAYRGKLRSALDIYERDRQLNTPEARRLREVLDHLAHIVYRWLGDSRNGP